MQHRRPPCGGKRAPQGARLAFQNNNTINPTKNKRLNRVDKVSELLRAAFASALSGIDAAADGLADEPGVTLVQLPPAQPVPLAAGGNGLGLMTSTPVDIRTPINVRTPVSQDNFASSRG